MTDSGYVLESLLEQHKAVRDALMKSVISFSRMTATTESIIESLGYAGFITKEEQEKAVDRLKEQMRMLEEEPLGKWSV